MMFRIIALFKLTLSPSTLIFVIDQDVLSHLTGLLSKNETGRGMLNEFLPEFGEFLHLVKNCLDTTV